ncbi:hypothetical protein ACFX2A_047144 [Malus domestica]
MSKLVPLLNVTGLSQLRKDGRPSTHGNGARRRLDCSHWCLPGVLDTWNKVLYTEFIRNSYKLSYYMKLFNRHVTSRSHNILSCKEKFIHDNTVLDKRYHVIRNLFHVS